MPVYTAYLQITEHWRQEFARSRKLHGEAIHCRKGCSECCSQMFQITEIEAAYISAGVKALPEQRRIEMQSRARAYNAAREKLLGRAGAPDAWGSLPPPGLRLPCPALVDGACSIYEHRPMICRKYGIPLYNPRKPDHIFACELNFKPGEEIHDGNLIQIHTWLHDEWAAVQSGYNERGGRRDPRPLTVARAILEDFEPYLPEEATSEG